jgi:hypothetical protein
MAIPDSEITARLLSLYQGPTPNLLTGIANLESTYRQFFQRKLYGVSALWPNESNQDGGSHVGLMQMPTSQADAWDWHANTSDAAALFSAKIAAAGRLANRIISNYPSLPALTGVQIENMALVLYWPYANASLTMQYYVPLGSGSNMQWAVNTANNPNGVAYADSVRAKMK